MNPDDNPLEDKGWLMMSGAIPDPGYVPCDCPNCTLERKMKLWDVSMWVDDTLTIQVMAENEEEAKVKAKAAIEERLGKDIDHGIMDVDDANRCECLCHDLWPGGCGQKICSVCGG